MWSLVDCLAQLNSKAFATLAQIRLTVTTTCVPSRRACFWAYAFAPFPLDLYLPSQVHMGREP
jgi:hypothetical protein